MIRAGDSSRRYPSDDELHQGASKPQAQIIPFPFPRRSWTVEIFERGDPVTYVDLFGDAHPGKIERVFDDASYLVRLSRDSMVRIGADIQPGRLTHRVLARKGKSVLQVKSRGHA